MLCSIVVCDGRLELIWLNVDDCGRPEQFLIEAAHELTVLILVTRIVSVTILGGLLEADDIKGTDEEDDAEAGAGIAPTLLKKTAESELWSTKSQMMNDSV